MTPLGLLGPLAPEWFKEHKVLGCPHPHIPSGKYFIFLHVYFNVDSGFKLYSFSDHFPLLVEFELSPNAHQSNSNGLIGRR